MPICHLIIWLQSEMNCLTELARKPSTRWKSSLGWTFPNRYLHQSKHSLKYASSQVCQASLKFRNVLIRHHHSKLSFSKTPLNPPNKTLGAFQRNLSFLGSVCGTWGTRVRQHRAACQNKQFWNQLTQQAPLHEGSHITCLRFPL